MTDNQKEELLKEFETYKEERLGHFEAWKEKHPDVTDDVLEWAFWFLTHLAQRCYFDTGVTHQEVIDLVRQVPV